FIVKAQLLVFVMMWVRWTLPRLRIDQVMMTCLKYLLPISCALLLGVSLWEVLARPYLAPYFSYGMCGVTALLLAWGVFSLAATVVKMPVAGVVTPWGPGIAPGPLGPRPNTTPSRN